MRWAPDSGLRWRSGGRCWWRCSWYTVLRSPLVVMVLVEATFYPPRSAFNGTPSIFRNATRGPLRYSPLRTCNNLLKTLYTISLHIHSSCRTSFYGTPNFFTFHLFLYRAILLWPIERVNFMPAWLLNLSYLGLQSRWVKIYETRKKNVINSIWPKTKYKKYSPVLYSAVEKRTHRLDVEARVFFHRETLFSWFCSRSTAASWSL